MISLLNRLAMKEKKKTKIKKLHWKKIMIKISITQKKVNKNIKRYKKPTYMNKFNIKRRMNFYRIKGSPTTKYLKTKTRNKIIIKI